MNVETKNFICIKEFYIFEEGEIYELEIVDYEHWIKPDIWHNSSNTRITWEKFLECFREVRDEI